MPGIDEPPRQRAGGDTELAGRYLLREALGRGGMATVYRAWDTKLERDVAVKVFAADDAVGTDQDRIERREREVRLLAQASHPHLVTLFDAEWADGSAGTGFLVMELIRGDSLRRRLDGRGPDVALAAQLAVELGEALAYLHDEGIVHRDLKPENILLTGRGDGSVTAKLVDFGIAQLVGDERITADGQIIGTAAYLAPEQVAGQQATPAADVYSLGLVLIECLTGRRVFPGAAVESAVARLSSDPVPPAGLPAEWRELLAAMTARDPQRRPAAAEVAQVAAALPVAGVRLGAEVETAALTKPLATATEPMAGAGAALAAAEAAEAEPAQTARMATDLAAEETAATMPLPGLAGEARGRASDRSAAHAEARRRAGARPRRRMVIALAAAAVVAAAAGGLAAVEGHSETTSPTDGPSAPAPTDAANPDPTRSVAPAADTRPSVAPTPSAPASAAPAPAPAQTAEPHGAQKDSGSSGGADPSPGQKKGQQKGHGK
ncbi:serine/threonine-protein kinase [Gryllotalpicola ginsengisoli]|uniref:serine/threonine-protein kinase n=1 Tax=Gryllotalpicola ginsengisoli TaxID=444608 RepID=UPI0003B77498|nr:serine/threonine-protein kinase [Gryllotalpicola ginsengisoli]